MANSYVDAKIIQESAEAPESTENSKIWETLAEAVSRLFDKAAQVPDNFFAKTTNTVSTRVFLANGTEYVEIAPYIPDSITAISVDAETVVLNAGVAGVDYDYFERDGFLIFNYAISKNKTISVSAKWGFAAIPADIQQACIEQALFMWRRKDAAFAEFSGVPASVVQAQLSPTFELVAQQYREIYSANSYFA